MNNKAVKKFVKGEKVRYVLKNDQLEYGSIHVVETVYFDGVMCKLENSPYNDWWCGAFEVYEE